MKQITREQITQAIAQASEKINKNLIEEIFNVFIKIDEDTDTDMNNPTAQIIAVASLIQGKTNSMLEEVLIDLLCE